MDILSIKNHSFLKDLNEKELQELSKEIRQFIIEKVSKKGGHLSGNLGVVELTIALHKYYPKHQFIFDVGHQGYTHKILTGRAKYFDTLRTINGLSGLLSREEDPQNDPWEVGHASTSIAALCGFTINKKKAIAIIGDGALSGGEAFEGLELLGTRKEKATLIINENTFSISPNVGLMTKIKDKDKPEFFALLGFNYIGPIDGHSFSALEEAFKINDELKGPTIIHVKTIKGKGYFKSEEDKLGRWHATGPFNIETGLPNSINENYTTYVGAVSDYLSKYYRKYGHLLKVVNPAMSVSSSMDNLKSEMKGDYIDTGITEQLAASLSAALSLSNNSVFLAIYSSFAQRAYDQIHQDICLQNLHVVIGFDKAGLVGETGKTHQGIYDIPYLRTMPNIKILAPRDYNEVFDMLDYAFFKEKGPIALHYPNQLIKKENREVMDKDLMTIDWINLTKRTNPDLYFITYSSSIDYLFDTIKDFNIDLINARSIKPIDEKLLNEIAAKKKKIVVYDESLKDNALGAIILSYFNEKKINIDLTILGFPNEPIGVGSIDDLRKEYHLDKISVREKIKELL